MIHLSPCLLFFRDVSPSHPMERQGILKPSPWPFSDGAPSLHTAREGKHAAQPESRSD